MRHLCQYQDDDIGKAKMQGNSTQLLLRVKVRTLNDSNNKSEFNLFNIYTTKFKKLYEKYFTHLDDHDTDDVE